MISDVLVKLNTKQYLRWEFERAATLLTFSSVQFSSVAQSCPILWPHEPQHARPPVHHQLPESTQTHVHLVGDAIQPSHPLLSPSPPIFNLSQHQCLFKWVSSSPQVANWSFSFSISPSKVYSGLISFRIDLLDFLGVQGTLKSLLQHHRSNAGDEVEKRELSYTLCGNAN